MPAHGRRLLGFGDITGFGMPSQGILIETRPNAGVYSPCDGWVVYAGAREGYGRMMIINAGGGYHVLLAGLNNVDAELGQFVLTGEPIGDVGRAQRAPSEEIALLYVELRKDQQAIDPEPWWQRN